MAVSNELKKKKDEEASQLWIGIDPSAKLCKSCIWAYPDTEYTKGYENGNCGMYEPPESKPMDVLFEGADCLFYDKEE